MKQFRADLHIHTLLSPCADLEMTPKNIIARAKEMAIDIIGITDHNSTKHAVLVRKMAEKTGIFVLTGAEVTTKEEVHCLTFFEKETELEAFQQFIDENATKISNPDGHFGYQPVIDENEDILEMIPHYLPAALKRSISEVQQKVEDLNGIFIPAHIDRAMNGLLSQLGFIPENLKFDALGVLKHSATEHVKKHGILKVNFSFIRNSDAHYLQQIGEIYTVFQLRDLSFSEIKKALNQVEGRWCEWI